MLFFRYFKWVLFFFVFQRFLLAQIIGPSAVEVNFEYEASFQPDYNDLRKEVKTWKEIDFVRDHAGYLFGLLSSEKLRADFGFDLDLVGGLGAPRRPEDNTIAFKGFRGDKELSYAIKGTLILHKKVAEKWLADGEVTLPLPYQMNRIYREKCTDSHYTSLGDYWYFYDAFRKNCEDLSQEPIARSVKIKISPSSQRKLDLDPRLDLLREGGKEHTFLIYTVSGFEENSLKKKDAGRKNFNIVNRRLKALGFSEKKGHLARNRPLNVYTKTVKDSKGKNLTVEIRRLLAETGIDENNISFARFFKEAIEKSDVFLYDGHSGLGSNLDIPALESLVGKFHFKEHRRQIFFFDSCSSYSYYLTQFRAEKTRATIDVITNGLSSLFESAPDVHMAFIESLLDFSHRQQWPEILEKMEKPLKGGTFLLNVGAI